MESVVFDFLTILLLLDAVRCSIYMYMYVALVYDPIQ